jgi:hypothetical protein
MEAELAFSIDNPDNDLKTLNLKLTLKDIDEAKQIAGGQKDVSDDDATEQIMTWMKQHRWSWQDWQTQQTEDEASQAPTDAVNHDDGGQCQPGDQCDDPEYSKHQGQESHDSHGQRSVQQTWVAWSDQEQEKYHEYEKSQKK